MLIAPEGPALSSLRITWISPLLREDSGSFEGTCRVFLCAAASDADRTPEPDMEYLILSGVIMDAALLSLTATEKSAGNSSMGKMKAMKRARRSRSIPRISFPATVRISRIIDGSL
jgi:hypothetical protein